MNSNEAVLISAQCNKLLWERRLRVGSFASVRQGFESSSGQVVRTHNPETEAKAFSMVRGVGFAHQFTSIGYPICDDEDARSQPRADALHSDTSRLLDKSSLPREIQRIGNSYTFSLPDGDESAMSSHTRMWNALQPVFLNGGLLGSCYSVRLTAIASIA